MDWEPEFSDTRLFAHEFPAMKCPYCGSVHIEGYDTVQLKRRGDLNLVIVGSQGTGPDGVDHRDRAMKKLYPPNPSPRGDSYAVQFICHACQHSDIFLVFFNHSGNVYVRWALPF